MAGLGTRPLPLPPPVAATGEVSVTEVEVEEATVVPSLLPEEAAEVASGPRNLTALLARHSVTASGKTAYMSSEAVT